jgi:3-deoxy-D-manno-octulosonate 8-phosphate phosphatase KdsC-like HAD superfamily phosphatase
LRPDEVAYIGDDTNDLEVLQAVGLSAAPADAFPYVLETVTYQCVQPGGRGAFREFAELIIAAQIPAEFTAFIQPIERYQE